MAVRRLALEGLENRNLMAGNVSVSVDGGGNLFVTGNDASNGVSIQQVDRFRYVVTGFDVAGNPTRINGQLGPVVVNGVTNDITVDLNAGNDVLVMGNNAIRNQTMARQFTGDATLTIQPSPVARNPATTDAAKLRVERNLWIRTDEGADAVHLVAFIGSDDLRGDHYGGVGQILTGDANDRVNVEATRSFDDLLLETGGGNDVVTGRALRVDDFLFAALGNGADRLTINDSFSNHSHLIGNAGNDFIRVTGFQTFLETFLFGEGGNDRIEAVGLRIGTDLQIITHDGADEVDIRNVRVFDDLFLDSGSANDVVFFDSVNVTDLTHVVMGSENDLLTIGNSTGREALLDGSSGFDDVNSNGGNNWGTLNVINFEA